MASSSRDLLGIRYFSTREAGRLVCADLQVGGNAHLKEVRRLNTAILYRVRDPEGSRIYRVGYQGHHHPP